MLRKYEADFLSIALKETKAGPRSSGTPVLVKNNFELSFSNYVFFSSAYMCITCVHMCTCVLLSDARLLISI